jgi:hypothetical protein
MKLRTSLLALLFALGTSTAFAHHPGAHPPPPTDPDEICEPSEPTAPVPTPTQDTGNTKTRTGSPPPDQATDAPK